MKWHNRWMELAHTVASWSKDNSRQVGCVIIGERQTVVSLGWNGLPRGLNDDIEERNTKPAKHLWTEHAERNAIFNAAANGQPLTGCMLYTTLHPCADCARAIIQSGINRLYCPPADMDSSWADHFHVAFRMLIEAGVEVTCLELS